MRLLDDKLAEAFLYEPTVEGECIICDMDEDLVGHAVLGCGVLDGWGLPPMLIHAMTRWLRADQVAMFEAYQLPSLSNC